jgi:hypothetical protein
MLFSAPFTLDVGASLAALRVDFARALAAPDVVSLSALAPEILPTESQNFSTFDFDGADAVAAGAAIATAATVAIATTKTRTDVMALPSRRRVVRVDAAYARSVTVPWHQVCPSAPTSAMLAPEPSGTAL